MLIDIKNASKHFALPSSWLRPASTLRAVERVDLTINEGETAAVVGESGSGKTTLARMIAGLYPPSGGAIFWNGHNIDRLSGSQRREFRRNLQMVFQDPYSSLDPRFTIQRIMQEAFTLEPSCLPHNRARRIEEMLKAVELPSDILLRYPHEFSGGERQRIAIARALVLRPNMLILDEAVSSLDVLVQNEILKLLSVLKANFGLTYLFISHNLRVVKKISDKIAVMYKGRIVEQGPSAEVIRRPAHPYTQELLTAALDYRFRHDERRWSLPENGQGRDLGQGHWVMDTRE